MTQPAADSCGCAGCAARPTPAAEARMTIGQLARVAEVTTSALRFYEAEGLVTPVARTPAGYRLYAPEQVDQVRFLRRAQRLGLSLTEVGELLAAADDTRPQPVREQLRSLVENKIDSVRQQADELRDFADQLERVHRRLAGPAGGRCRHVTTCRCLSMEVLAGP